MEQVRFLAADLKFEQPLVLVEDRREGRRQRGGERTIKAGCLVPVALLGQVHRPAAAWLALERVPKAQLTNASHAVGRNEGKQ